MKKTTFIFDFDGTIADSIHMGIELYNNNIAKKLRTKLIVKDNIEELMGKSTYMLLNEHNISLVKLPILLYKIKKLMTKRMVEIPLIEGIKEALLELDTLGFNMGILTSNNKKNVELFLKGYGIENLFNFVYSEKNLFGKDKAIKNMIEKEKLNKIIYVGDETRDIEACKKINIPIISVGWGFNTNSNLKSHNPEYFIENPIELVEIAKTLD